jgi:hypothetical protein
MQLVLKRMMLYAVLDNRSISGRNMADICLILDPLPLPFLIEIIHLSAATISTMTNAL